MEMPWVLLSAMLFLLFTGTSHAQEVKEKATDVVVEGHIYKPAKLKPGPDLLSKLKLPDGFKISVFDDGLSNTRMLAVGDVAGKRLYVSRRKQGDLLLLKDDNGDGRADDNVTTVATGDLMHGIAIRDNKAYYVTVKDVYVADIKPDGTFGKPKLIIDDLPDGGQHPNRTLAVGPDGKLYISVGSTCNACAETSIEAATVLRAETDGSTRTVFASGLRNTIGFGWHPTTGQLWGADHGIDWLGDDAQKEEWNLLEEGKFYGWPYIAGEGIRNPQDEPPPPLTMEAVESSTTLPVLGYTAHSAPMQLAFYREGNWPAEYHGDAFIAMRGSWNRKPPSGYEVVRVDFDEQGKPQKIEPFITGFLVEQDDDMWGQYARLAGMAITPDGSAMFIADDENGVIYRVVYEP